ncbi:triose-phosphate isomerase [Candidatus Hepatobacter penaei]|uniref:triose-phosphate isomerase n=1 Tax=Candidatus Hepatobacter penaei TaxID=1274402 RepID=UPI0006990D5B|nr:triose-phosphate isomerase family protein [Candidatus Hepatobacter penaei]
MSQHKRIVANFKTHGRVDFFAHYLSVLSPLGPTPYTLILCPPAPYLSLFRDALPKDFLLGAQDISPHDNTTVVTGDVTPAMLVDMGVSHVLIGHSERRTHHHESYTHLQQKINQALHHDLTPILCVGEPYDVYQQGKTHDFLADELRHILPATPHKPMGLAYEPLWAIGSGKTPTLQEIHGVTHFLQQCIHAHHQDTFVLYGGSVSSANAQSILALPSIDGVLVGKACLDPAFLMDFAQNTSFSSHI